MIENISYNSIMKLDETHPNRSVVVIFGHSQCPHCVRAKNSLTILQNADTDIYYCDTMSNPSAVKTFSITSVPLILIIKNGNIIGTVKWNQNALSQITKSLGG